MSRSHLNTIVRVISLTLSCSLAFAGCAQSPGKAIQLSPHKSAASIPCNSRAYVRQELGGYITARYSSQSPVRLGIIPFSAPANISARNVEVPGLGDQVAEQVHAELLATEQVPIVEILPRQDWPRKKEEFFLGNFGALRTARDAGYDLILVGQLLRPTSLDRLHAAVKVIDTESRMTVYYGETAVESYERLERPLFDRWGWNWHQRRPELIPTAALVRQLAYCVAQELVTDDPVLEQELDESTRRARLKPRYWEEQ